MSKIGRNDPCACGSGKKYKKCCLMKTYTEIGKEESISKRITQDILRFLNENFREHLDDALFCYWGDFNPKEQLQGMTLQMSDANFWEWVVYDWLVDEDNEKTLIDLYIENTDKLTLDEHKVLRIMKNAVISLYEVQDVFPDKGLLLKDLLLGGEYDVREKAATKSVRKWDIFATRLIYVDGQYIMSGCVYPYSVDRKEALLYDIDEEYEEYKLDNPDAPFDEFLKKNGELFNYYWYDPIIHPPQVKIVTKDGEPLLFSKAIFDLKDKDVTIKALSKIKELEQKESDMFVWFDNRNKDGSESVLGRIEITDKNLIIECNSKERLERSKGLVLKHASDFVVHKADAFQDVMQAMKSLKNKPSEQPTSKIPMEIQQELYTKFMRKHCEEWLNNNIPALNGKTPLESVKTKEGKEKVTELLKSFENKEEHNKREGKPYYDISWMWERLGIEREA